MITLKAQQRCCARLATLSIIVLGSGLGALQAQTPVAIDVPVLRAPPVKQAPGFSPVKCANPAVTLTATKGRSGIVRLQGSVTNGGSLALELPLQLRYVMNVSYPPKTYNQVGISEELCTQSLGGLAVGQVVSFDCSYRIPDFADWVPERPPQTPMRPTARPGDAKRLFTLGVVRADMAPFSEAQDCNPDDTEAFVEVLYRIPATVKSD